MRQLELITGVVRRSWIIVDRVYWLISLCLRTCSQMCPTAALCLPPIENRLSHLSLRFCHSFFKPPTHPPHTITHTHTHLTHTHTLNAHAANPSLKISCSQTLLGDNCYTVRRSCTAKHAITSTETYGVRWKHHGWHGDLPDLHMRSDAWRWILASWGRRKNWFDPVRLCESYSSNRLWFYCCLILGPHRFKRAAWFRAVMLTI